MYAAGEESKMSLCVSFKELCAVSKAMTAEIGLPARATLAQHLFRVNNAYHYTIC
jgi:hypothetical protein